MLWIAVPDLLCSGSGRVTVRETGPDGAQASNYRLFPNKRLSNLATGMFFAGRFRIFLQSLMDGMAFSNSTRALQDAGVMREWS
jgi:hypothetical protein